ncbi:MAG: hypothetical protein H6862_05345 [Rhodospirillales bacterium]|nr:hypothetical protein [Rhodospirillales bacterium]
MSFATTADDFAFSAPEPAQAPVRKGFLSRMFNAAVKAAPTAAASAVLGFALRTTALSTAIAAGAGTAATLAAIATASGTSAALITAGKEAWTGRREGRKILDTLSSRDVLKKVRNNFAIAAGFGALGATLAPLVIDYARHIDFGAAATKIADFFIPTASAYDYSFGDGSQSFLEMAGHHATSHGAATTADALSAQPPHAAPAPNAIETAPRPAAPAPEPAAPSQIQNQAPAEPTPAPPAPKSDPFRHARTLIAASDANEIARFEKMTPQQLKDEGVKLLWGKGVPKNPELARALFETSAATGNQQAIDALSFMDKHGMGLPTQTGTPSTSTPAPASPTQTASPRPEPLPKGTLAARCTVERPAMEGLELKCDVKQPTMYPGDRIDVAGKDGKLTKIFYQASDSLRKLTNAISTGSFLTGRVAPVVMSQDQDLLAWLEKHKPKPDLAMK